MQFITVNNLFIITCILIRYKVISIVIISSHNMLILIIMTLIQVIDEGWYFIVIKIFEVVNCSF